MDATYGYKGDMGRLIRTAVVIHVMLASLAVPAQASVPLVLTPTPEAVESPGERWGDLAIPGLTSFAFATAIGGVGMVLGEGEGVNLARNAMLVGLMIGPPSTLVTRREAKPGVDAILATWIGGMVGLGSGFLASRLLPPGTGAVGVVSRAAVLGIGQGVGCTWGYHWFLHERSQPAVQRKPAPGVRDLPMDEWDLKKERRYPS
jgi:hypothetical protein